MRTTPRTLTEVRTLLAISEDVWSHGTAVGRESDFMVRPEGLAALKEAGVELRVLISDVQDLIDQERARLANTAAAAPLGLRGEGWFADFKDDAAIDTFITELAALRPDRATVVNFGQTVQGRPIRGLRITGPGDDSGRAGVFIHAGLHAREWVAPMTGAYIADRLTRGGEGDERIRHVQDSLVVYVIPLVNRDGYEHSWTTQRLWRKNRRPNGNGTFGVDLNRNFNFQWGAPGSSSLVNNQEYRGPAPESEPEVAALASFIRQRPELALHFDLHSYGQYVLQPWGYTWEASPIEATLDGLGTTMASTIRETGGARYSSGATRRLLYPASGTAMDWAFGAAGLISFTLELRDTGSTGFILPPSQIIPTAQEAFEALLGAMSTLADSRVSVIFHEGVPEVLPSGGEARPLVWVQRGALPVSQEAPVLVWRTSPIGEWHRTRARSVDSASGLWELSFRAGAAGSATWWYLECAAVDADERTVTAFYPASGPMGPRVSRAGTVRVLFADDFESDRGWQIGAPDDTAIAGIWTRGDPEGTTHQPEHDVSPRPGQTRCFFTGYNPRDAAGNGDVDGGTTTLVSPSFDLTGEPDAMVSYFRWYNNMPTNGSAPDDSLLVQLSVGGGPWVDVETIGPGSPDSAGGWRRASWRVSDFLPPGQGTRVRFVASDTGAPGVVEAAIDEFKVSVEVASPSLCPGDVNGDGRVSSQDVYDFLAAFAAGDADFNGRGGTTVQDLYEFLGAWLAGCD